MIYQVSFAGKVETIDVQHGASSIEKLFDTVQKEGRLVAFTVPKAKARTIAIPFAQIGAIIHLGATEADVPKRKTRTKLA